MADGYIDRRLGSRLSWPAIFAGTFVFLAIEVTFGVLGTAVFASAENPASAHPVTGVSAGIGIWLVILSIIALYFAGRAATSISGAVDRHIGMYHGLVTFGMSVFTSILVSAMMLGSTTLAPASNAAAAGPATVGDVVSTAGYWLFVALLLGMIAAALGGSQAVRKPVVLREETAETPGVRKIA
jgi:hypothetical protein